MTKKHWELEDFIRQNQRRVYYQLSKLQIQDKDGEFFQEGLVAMWKAYENYNADKGPMATYMNYQIRNRFIDMIRKSTVEKKYLEQLVHQHKVERHTGNYLDGNQLTLASQGEDNPLNCFDDLDEQRLHLLTEDLTEKQQIWFQYAIVNGFSNKEIAEKEKVTVEAVKSWAKRAKQKLRSLDLPRD